MQRQIDVITFTSSSTVRNFSRLFDDLAEMKKATEGAAVACIGPITADTARELGFAVSIVAEENTVPALAQAIVRHFADNRAPVPRFHSTV
jgi:uroporphyrinogen III methyltransferase/synthase